MRKSFLSIPKVLAIAAIIVAALAIPVTASAGNVIFTCGGPGGPACTGGGGGTGPGPSARRPRSGAVDCRYVAARSEGDARSRGRPALDQQQPHGGH